MSAEEPPPAEDPDRRPRTSAWTISATASAAWIQGQRLRIEDYLAEAAEADRARVLHELLAIEIELRTHGRRAAGPARVPGAISLSDPGEIVDAFVRQTPQPRSVHFRWTHNPSPAAAWAGSSRSATSS